jgi:SAM-dependent methyltransferase
MNETARKSTGRSLLRRWLGRTAAPLLRQYTATKQRQRFTDDAAAQRLLAPLMREPEAANYHRFHLERYLITMEFLADLPRHFRVLEVGAPPYGMTVLLRQWLFDEVVVTGYDEKSSDQTAKTYEAPVTIKADDGTILFDGVEQRFNLEIHRWPLPDDSFDLIICCETFEHLGLDPMHAYAEANRVLKTGGRLFITVPNGLAFSNGIRYLSERQPNSFPYYRPEGFSLRHQREPTPQEVAALLRAAGFEPEFVETFNVIAPDLDRWNPAKMLALSLLARPLNQRRELLAARGIKRGPVADRYPTGQDLYYPWDVQRFRTKKTAST